MCMIPDLHPRLCWEGTEGFGDEESFGWLKGLVIGDTTWQGWPGGWLNASQDQAHRHEKLVLNSCWWPLKKLQEQSHFTLLVTSSGTAFVQKTRWTFGSITEHSPPTPNTPPPQQTSKDWMAEYFKPLSPKKRILSIKRLRDYGILFNSLFSFSPTPQKEFKVLYNPLL